MDGNNENVQSVSCWTIESSLKVFEAIEDDNLEDIKSLFKDNTFINIHLQITGVLAGYTALHLACMKNNKKLVELLVEDYHADVNTVADDGAQPIHLACFSANDGSNKCIEILLKAGANSDAEIGQNLYSKYFEGVWCGDFGNKMTLLTFSILYKNNPAVVSLLIDSNANLKVRSLKNKTLLMYAGEKKEKEIFKFLLSSKIKDQEWINARDNDGFSIVHYVFNPKILKTELDSDYEIALEYLKNFALTSCLIDAGADLYATINGDPDTLLINMAAYGYFANMLHQLLPHYEDISKSKALRNVTRPLKGPSTRLQERIRKASTDVILKDLVNRRTFGLPVPKDESKLMDKLIAEDTTLGELINAYEQNFIQRELKIKVLEYGNESITYYDFIMLSFDDKKCRLLVKNKLLINVFKNSFPKGGIHLCLQPPPQNPEYLFFETQIKMRIGRASKRAELFDALKKIENLCKVIPLPYELVLMIVEYLNIQDLKNFTNAFYL